MKTPEHAKKVILDTSVILHESGAVRRFKNHDVYIPFCVIEEMDRFKRDIGEKGRNAREFSRFMDFLRIQQGSLTNGVKIEGGSRLFVNMDFNLKTLPPQMNEKLSDNRILSLSLFLKNKFQNSSVELITKDINLRIKADILNIASKDYKPEKDLQFNELYTGTARINISDKELESFRANKYLKYQAGAELYPNQYVIMKSENDKQLGRFDPKEKKIVQLIQPEKPIWGIIPRNIEQSMAIDALINDQISLVSLLGKAGTGKTLLAMAAGLHKTLEENKYQRLLVSRPVFPMGKDIGYLPGDISQKLDPWMRPIYDSMEFLMGLGKKPPQLTREMMSQGIVQIEPLAYIRGRSLPGQFLIVDEAQNLTPHEVKTIITRAGAGAKVILTGDCSQIDNPYVDSSSSGFTFAIEKLKNTKLCAHVTLHQGERSALAELAANIL